MNDPLIQELGASPELFQPYVLRRRSPLCNGNTTEEDHSPKTSTEEDHNPTTSTEQERKLYVSWSEQGVAKNPHSAAPALLVPKYIKNMDKEVRPSITTSLVQWKGDPEDSGVIVPSSDRMISQKCPYPHVTPNSIPMYPTAFGPHIPYEGINQALEGTPTSTLQLLLCRTIAAEDLWQSWCVRSYIATLPSAPHERSPDWYDRPHMRRSVLTAEYRMSLNRYWSAQEAEVISLLQVAESYEARLRKVRSPWALSHPYEDETPEKTSEILLICGKTSVKSGSRHLLKVKELWDDRNTPDKTSFWDTERHQSDIKSLWDQTGDGDNQDAALSIASSSPGSHTSTLIDGVSDIGTLVGDYPGSDEEGDEWRLGKPVDDLSKGIVEEGAEVVEE
ncbi:hypothetical protein M231_02540 [Tremella mesenterica]|uniref:Uncharacterized protein n=1 Tax=Tremella mesenterica TaxID=5217 RepID=A0A4Q1BQ91_TREME|nr:hypothetical protein M231_02540 [Tremella mesenterica]